MKVFKNENRKGEGTLTTINRFITSLNYRGINKMANL